MRLGYAVAPTFSTMRPFVGSVNALVKYGGAALKDTGAGEVKRRSSCAKTGDSAHGYDIIPSETNFFMVGLGREVQPVIGEFREKGILVGRPFPPMTQHMRVSVGTEEDMTRFLAAFKQIFPARTNTSARG